MKEVLKEVLTRYFDSDLGGVHSQYVAKDFMEEYTYWREDAPKHWKQLGVNFESVNSYDGEGQGDDYWSVYRFWYPEDVSQEVYIRFNGWYQSYNGLEYQGWEFVEPVEKVITVWKAT